MPWGYGCTPHSSIVSLCCVLAVLHEVISMLAMELGKSVMGAEGEVAARKEALAQLQQEQWSQMHCRMDPDDQQYVIGGQVRASLPLASLYR